MSFLHFAMWVIQTSFSPIGMPAYLSSSNFVVGMGMEEGMVLDSMACSKALGSMVLDSKDRGHSSSL